MNIDSIRSLNSVCRLAVVALILVAAAGCGDSYRAKPAFFYTSDDAPAFYDPQNLSGSDEVKPIELDKFYFLEDRKQEDSEKNDRTQTAYAKAVADKGSRNRLQAILLERSDRIFEQHVSEVLASQNNINAAMDIGALTSSAISAAAIPTGTKTFWSVLAAFFTGSKNAINEQVYVRFLAARIIRENIEARNEFKPTIVRSRDRDTTQYTVDDMVRDVEEYHRRGSFVYGLARLAADLKDPGTGIVGTYQLDGLENPEIRLVIRERLRYLALRQLQFQDLESDIKIEPVDRKAGDPITKITVTMHESVTPDAASFTDGKLPPPTARAERYKKDVENLLKIHFMSVAEFMVDIKTKS